MNLISETWRQLVRRRLWPVADGGPNRLPAVFVDQAAQLFQLRVVTPSGHGRTQ